MRYWIDPPSGWQYGFPKLWDEETDPPVTQWLRENGYPVSDDTSFYRSWPEQEDEK